MKLQITLAFIFSTLFFNNVNAASVEAEACTNLLNKRDYTGALTQADKALKRDKNDKDALLCQGRAYSNSGNLNAAITAFQAAEKQSADAFDKTIVALLTGQAYQLAKQYDQALTSYQQTIQHAQVAKSAAFERVGQNAIGDVYFETKQFPLALAAYLAGNKLAANDNERGESNENIALTYHNMQQHDSALEYQIKAFLMHQRVGTLDQYAHSSIELGRYYLLVKNYISAESTLNKIIKFAKEQGGAYYEAQGNSILAQVKAATGDMPAAKALAEQARLIAKNTNDQDLAQAIEQETQHLFK